MKTTRPTESHERVFLVGVGLKRASHVPGIDAGDAERASLEELAELARSAGAQVAGSIFQMRDKIDPATVIGRGKIEEVKIEAHLHHAPLIIFDRNLSPTQLRNLEKGTECRVIDRTQLILDIFARHARSREGQLQVELAQLNYMLPRLAGSARELSRQAGGIGTRGPGGRTFDCVFLSHVLHDFDAPAASAIVARAARLVRAGGKLVIVDVLVPEGGHTNPVESLFDLMMLVEVPGGRTHPISDVREWMVSSGMNSPKSNKLYFGTLLDSQAQR